MKHIHKNLKVLLSLPFLLACLSFDPNPITYWKTLFFPPKDNDEEVSLLVTYEIVVLEKNKEYEMSISLQNEIYPNKLLIYYSDETLVWGLNTLKKEFTFYPNIFSQGENIIILSMVSGKSKDVLNIPTYLKTHDTFNPAYLNNGAYESPKNYIQLKNNSLLLTGDTFKFYNFDLFAEDEYYSYFKLNKFKFSYNGEFTYKNAYLLIKDEYSYYNYFSKFTNNSYRVIPIIIKQDNEGLYYFVYKNKLYVEPHTYLMSPIESLGYVETNNFYFPKERFANQQSIEMAIIIENCGINDLNIQYYFTYYSSLNFIGDCQNSKYCVHTSSSSNNDEEDDFDEIVLC